MLVFSIVLCSAFVVNGATTFEFLVGSETLIELSSESDFHLVVHAVGGNINTQVQRVVIGDKGIFFSREYSEPWEPNVSSVGSCQ